MPTPSIGVRPGGAPSARPGGSPSIVQHLNDIFSRSGSSPAIPRSTPTPTPTPTAQPLSLSDRLRGKNAPAPAPSIAGGYRPSSTPTGNPNLSARLAGRAAPTVPGGIPVAAEVAARSPLLAPAPTTRPISGTNAGILIGALSALPTEVPRLRDLASNPDQYWQEQDRQLREQYPFMFPTAEAARPGLLPALRPALALAPFEGGQSPGVLYNVEILQSIDGNNTLFSVSATGPISGVRREYVPGEETNRVSFFLQTGAGEIGLGGRVGGGDVQSGIDFSIAGAVRVDGQPDTGGNPAPIVDPNAPARPALAAPNTLYIEPAPSRVPNAVPYNAPTISPSRTINPTAPNPFAPPAPAPTPTTEPRPTPTPNPYAPVEPSASPRQDRQQQTSDSNSIIPWLIPAAAIGALAGWALAPRTTTATTPAPSPGTGTGTPFVCRFQDDPYSRGIDSRTRGMQEVELAIQTFQTTMLNQLDAKLGPQLPNGGVSGKLGRLGALASKTWNFLQVDRVLNVLSWIGILHNAYMLSNSLGQTLFSAIGNVLDAFGIQKVDEEGNEEAYDVNEIVNQWVDNFGKTTFGVESWTGIKAEWKAFNRIYQAASNIISSLQSITFSMVEMLETISNYTGRIGNALRKSGAVLQNSFNWMNPSANYTNNRFFNALNNVQEAVENIDQVASEVLSIQQTATELANQKTEFEQAMNTATEAVTTAETQSAGTSQRPLLTIDPSDEKKAD